MTWRSPRWAVVLAALGIAAAVPGAAQAVGPTQLRDGRSLFDARAAAIARGGENPAPPARARAGEQLARNLGPLGNVTSTRSPGRRATSPASTASSPRPATPRPPRSRSATSAPTRTSSASTLRTSRRCASRADTATCSGRRTSSGRRPDGGVSTLDNGLRAAVTRARAAGERPGRAGSRPRAEVDGPGAERGRRARGGARRRRGPAAHEAGRSRLGRADDLHRPRRPAAGVAPARRGSPRPRSTTT